MSGVTLLGTVFLADGINPSAGAVVSVFDGDGSVIAGIKPNVKAAAQTNAVGAFELNDRLALGIYNIRVSQIDETLLALMPLVVSKDSGPALMLKIRANAGCLEGTALDAAGKPVAGAEVPIADKSQDAFYFTTSDDKGSYLIDSIAPGKYLALVRFGDGRSTTWAVRRDISIASAKVERSFTLRLASSRKASTGSRNGDSP